jgi:rRNA-processing protein FCF1
VDMRRTLTQSAVMKELESVAEQLAAVKTSRLKRLELLRRQAQLGDLRDAVAERARRQQQQQP